MHAISFIWFVHLTPVLQCELYPKLSVISVLGLLSRLKVQPLSLALSRCAAHGPCALSPKVEASPGGSLVGFMEQVYPGLCPAKPCALPPLVCDAVPSRRSSLPLP